MKTRRRIFIFSPLTRSTHGLRMQGAHAGRRFSKHREEFCFFQRSFPIDYQVSRQSHTDGVSVNMYNYMIMKSRFETDSSDRIEQMGRFINLRSKHCTTLTRLSAQQGLMHPSSNWQLSTFPRAAQCDGVSSMSVSGYGYEYVHRQGTDESTYIHDPSVPVFHLHRRVQSTLVMVDPGPGLGHGHGHGPGHDHW